VRTMCGSRTGGRSLPCVMSDWQRCVDWFLAKYCRCRLCLDSCWCRWRTSAKGRCRWGLQVWSRQVGFVWGTRWPVGSSAGRMVAWTARWSHGRFLVEPQNQGRDGTTWEPSHEWRLAQATPNSRGLQWFSRKPLGYSVEPQNRGRRLDEEVWPTQAGSTAQEGRSDRLGQSDCLGRSNRPGGRSDCPGRWRRDASKRRTRVGIARLASRLSRLRSPGIHPMKKIWRLPNSPLRGLYP
jgi:hypothetical protein